MLWMIARYGEPDSRCNELSMSAIKFRQFANCGQTTGRKICLLFEQFGIKADYADDEDKIFIQFRSSDIKVQVADAAYLFVHRLLKTSDIPDFAFNKFKKADMRCFA